MLSFLFDLFISSLITLMIYSLCRYLGVYENAAGFIAGCLFVWIMGVLHGKHSNDDDE
jgi:hypothetical protein